MEILDVRLDGTSRAEVWKVYFLGDEHGGAGSLSDGTLDTIIDEIADNPKARVISVGDMVEAINTSDPRFDPAALDPRALGFPAKGKLTMSAIKTVFKNLKDLPKKQADFMCAKYKRIKGKFLGKLIGNHEEKVSDKYHFNVHDYICDTLGCPSLSSEAVIRLFFTRLPGENSRTSSGQKVEVFASHGSGGGTSLGGNLRKISDVQAWYPEADIYAMGHCHQKVFAEESPIRVVGKFGEGRVADWTKIILLTGSFFRTYVAGQQTYAGKKLYKPVPLGCPSVEIKPHNSFYVMENGRKIEHSLRPSLRAVI